MPKCLYNADLEFRVSRTELVQRLTLHPLLDLIPNLLLDLVSLQILLLLLARLLLDLLGLQILLLLLAQSPRLWGGRREPLP